MTAAEIIELVHERDRLLAQVAEIDAAIGGIPSLSSPVVPAIAANPTNDERHKATIAKLEALRPWFHVLTHRYRQIVDLRVAGKSSTEIAAELRMNASSVAKMTSEARLKMDLARAADEMPRSGDRRHRRWHLSRGNIKKQPDGRFRFSMRVGGGKTITGPVVNSYDEAESGRAAAAAAIATELEERDHCEGHASEAAPPLAGDQGTLDALRIPLQPPGPAAPPAPAPAADPSPPAPPAAPRKPGQKVCRRCDKPGHYTKTCKEAPPPVTPAEDEAEDEPPPPAPPADDEDLDDDEPPALPALPGEAPFGGFSLRTGAGTTNEDISMSVHATRTKRGIMAPLIRRDDPTERPVIVDVGGVDVVALEVGPATKATTRVRWQAGPGAWGSDVTEIARSTVLRDATDAEVEQDQSEGPEDPYVDEAAAAAG